MKPQKIIELSMFRKIKATNHPPFGSDDYFVASWAGLFARRLKKGFSQLDIECWRIDSAVISIQEKTVFGVRGVLFPNQFPIIRNVLTFQMLRRLRSYQKKYDLVVHYCNLFDGFGIVAPFLLKKSRIILSHLGGNPPSMATIKGKIKLRFFCCSFPQVYAITYARRKILDYLKKTKNTNHYFLPVGANFEQMMPMNKCESRRKLGLDPNKIYGVYVGKFFRLKGVDKIIEGYQRFSKKYNFSVILAGGTNDEKNDLYNEVIASKCKHFGPQPYEPGIMAVFYSAADFYFHPAFSKDFGGLDVSWMEALACNIPVLSPQLAELGTSWDGLGIAVENEGELFDKLEWMIVHCGDFKDCRAKAQRILDGDGAIIVKLKEIMDGKRPVAHNECESRRPGAQQ